MNLFVRYFHHECLAHDVQEAVDFLSQIKEIKLDNTVASRLQNFLDSSNQYPFRLKVSFSNYVLFLKTEANDVEQFHQFEQQRKEAAGDSKNLSMAEKKKSMLETLNREQPGWYEASLVFKRVVVDPVTQKCQYIDTRFAVRLKANSPMHCYERIIDHLKGRSDLDQRSQFPSAKNQNFQYKYLGE